MRTIQISFILTFLILSNAFSSGSQAPSATVPAKDSIAAPAKGSAISPVGGSVKSRVESSLKSRIEASGNASVEASGQGPAKTSDKSSVQSPAKTSDKSSTKAAAQAPVKAPTKASAITPTKTSTKAHAKPQTPANPYAQKALAQSAARMALQKKCDATYGDTIRKRTGDLQKQMMDLMEKERSAASAKRKNNPTFRKMGENYKQLHVKDSLAYTDTSANRMQRRKDAQNARLDAMKKMRAEERKIEIDPELAKIRQSIAVLRKQIEDSISVIIKNDPKCLSCYTSSR
jgi:histone deacetylase complex regulatory component SIN3